MPYFQELQYNHGQELTIHKFQGHKRNEKTQKDKRRKHNGLERK